MSQQMSNLARYLHLCDHTVETDDHIATHDDTHHIRLSSAHDVVGTHGADGRYYVANVEHTFPCESAPHAKHLKKLGHPQMYRKLRPEVRYVGGCVRADGMAWMKYDAS